MTVYCEICGRQMEVTLEEFTSDSEFFCSECSQKVLEFYDINPN